MSKNIDKNLINDLISLGLTEKESLVYCDLLKTPTPIGSTKIVRSTGLHGQFVYDALYALEEKGLVKYSTINGRKKFEATDTSRITDLIENKRIIAEKTIAKLNELATRPIGQEFDVFQGEHAYIQHQFEALEKMSDGGEILIISTDWGDLFTEKRYEFLGQYEKIRIKKNISIRFILNEGLREVTRRAKVRRPQTEFRFLPDHQSYSGICVFENSVDFYLMGEPIIVFAFKNTKIANGYHNFFNVLWSMAKR